MSSALYNSTSTS